MSIENTKRKVIFGFFIKLFFKKNECFCRLLKAGGKRKAPVSVYARSCRMLRARIGCAVVGNGKIHHHVIAL